MPAPNAEPQAGPDRASLKRLILYAASQLVRPIAGDKGTLRVEISYPGEIPETIVFNADYPIHDVDAPQIATPADQELLACLAAWFFSPEEEAIIDAIGDFSLQAKQLPERTSMSLGRLKPLLANLVERHVLINDSEGYRVADLALLALLRRHRLCKSGSSAPPTA